MACDWPRVWLILGSPCAIAMASFAVFFADDNAIGIERIQAADAAAAEAIARELHPDARFQAVDGELVSEANRVRLLGVWVGLLV